MTYPALLPAEGIARLRDALAGAGYTSAGIAAHIGPEATAATRRNDFRAALAATTAGTPLDTLIRLYVGNQTESDAAVARAFAPLPLDDAVAAGLVERVPGGLRAGLDLEPYGDAWWVVSDLPSGSRPGPLRPDHVLGIGNASTTLADSVIRTPVGRALDLGTGCGVQALHLSTHAHRITATDLSSRALRFAATTAALAGLDWDLRQGDLTEPVRGERFDLVVSNPPFVAGPGVATHTYRDSGRSGDAVCAELAARREGSADRGRHDAVPRELAARHGRGLGRTGRRLVRRQWPGRLGDRARTRRPGGVRRPVAHRRGRGARSAARRGLARLVRRAQGRGSRVSAW